MKSSINIKYDISDKHLLEEYYATGSHTEIIREVLSGVMNMKSCNAHIAYGPYGSGKSYVSVILANIVSKNISERAINHLSRQFIDVDTDVNDLINRYNNGQYRKYIIAKVNGYEGNLNDAILDAVFEALNENGMSYLIPGSINEIKAIIKRWKDDFSETYFNLQISIGESYEFFEDFLESLNDGNENAISLFASLYEELTAGAKLDLNKKQDLVKCIETICKKLNDVDIGLLIIYDEFGRYLQNIKPNEINIFMQNMQDIAELANNALNNFSLLFITHKPISYYFQSYSLETRSEFAKIEKRYNVYDIKSDYTTFLNITNKMIKSFKIPKIDKKNLLAHAKSMKKYRVFSSVINDHEVDKLILKNAYPLHPIAVYLLPKISSIFGQNERTLFTFLQDESSAGFKGYINRHKGEYYYPDILVDYFFVNIDQTYIENYKVFNLFMKYKSQLDIIPDDSIKCNTTRMLKFIFIWTICDGNSVAKLENSLLSYALDLDEDLINNTIKNLLEKKIVRYDNVRKTWEICETSNLDVEEEIRQVSNQVTVTQEDLLNLFNENNPFNLVYPKAYNNTFEMTRFAKLYFEFYDLSPKITDADVALHIFIDDIQDKENDPKNIYGCMMLDFQNLEGVLQKLFIIQDMMNLHYYKIDKAVINELEFEKRMLQNDLSSIYNKIFTTQCNFRIDGGERSFNSLGELEMFLDEYFSTVYTNTLTIVNDQINMFQISKVQQRAIVTVLDLILNNNSIELHEFFVGSKPDYLVWYSIYTSNFRDYSALLTNYIIDHTSGSFDTLMNILIEPPYGLRPTIALILIFFNLSSHLKDMLFYVNNNFIATITGDEIYRSIIHKEFVLTYKYSHFDHINRSYIENLLSIFPYVSEGVTNRSLAIQLCSALNNWYLALPVIIQQKAIENLGVQEITLLRIIESAKTDPQTSIESMQKIFNIEEVRDVKSMVEMSFNLFINNLEKNILKKNKIVDSKDFLSNISETQKKNNLFIQILSENDSLIERYANTIETLDICRWPISTFKMLEKTIQDDIDGLRNKVDADEVIIKGKRKAIIHTELSIKGKTVKDNIENLLNATKKYLTDREIEHIVYELFDEFVK